MSAVFDNVAFDAFNAADAAFFGTASCTVTAASGAVYAVNGYVERGKGPRALPTGQVIDADITLTLIQSTTTPMPDPKRGWRVVANGSTYSLDALLESDASTWTYSVIAL